MDEETRKELTQIRGILHLQGALLAVLYADHIEHDKRLRDLAQDPRESILAFRNYANHYLDTLLSTFRTDENSETIQVARERSRPFFRDVESVLINRGV